MHEARQAGRGSAPSRLLASPEKEMDTEMKSSPMTPDRMRTPPVSGTQRLLAAVIAAAFLLAGAASPAAAQKAAPAPAAGSPSKVDASLKHLAKHMQPNDGVVRGKILSSETGELLPAATIMVVEPQTGEVVKGAPATLDGTYEIILPAGTYSLRVSYISYSMATVTGVKVKAGQPTKLDVVLQPEGLVGEEIRVEAKLLENTEAAVLARQQRAPAVSDGLSAEQISRSSDTDAAEATKRVTGVSVVGDKYVYVRGLGERYSSTQLNGSRITSTETKRVVALDILPAKLIDNMNVQKTYTADQSAEFAGGVVDVNTKDFPDNLNVEFGQGVSVSPGSSFAGFGTYPGGSQDWIGFDDGRRALPGDIPDDQKVTPRGRFGTTGYTPEEIEVLGESFENVWDPQRRESSLNAGYNLVLGNQSSVLGRPLGYVASLSYGGKFDNQDEVQRSYAATEAGLVPYSNYSVERSTSAVEWGGLFNTTYRLTPAHKFSWRNTYMRNADDEVRTYEGISPNLGPEEPIKDQRIRWIERSTYATHLDGEHMVEPLAQSLFTWRFGSSSSDRDEPDNREVLYRYDPIIGQYILFDNGMSGQRFFSTMDDNELSGDVGWSMPLPALGYDTATLKAGGFYTDRDREFLARRFRFVPRSGVRPDSMDLSAPAEQIYTPENIRPTGFQLQENTRATDAYTANQIIKGGFVQGDVSFLTRYRIIAGARYEDSRQRLQTFELGNPNGVPVVAENIGCEWSPSASLVVKTSAKTNLRFVASRTLNRPDFRELAPFEYTEYVGGRSEIGNPQLEDAVIKNYDVRWERYPAVGELMAASFFYKDFERPIEVVVLPGVSRIVTYTNSDEATNYGVELEYRRSLANMWSKLSGFNLGVNLTLVKSEVVIGDSTGVQTSSERPLQGQSPYVFNGNLGYVFMGGHSSVNLLYNLYGKRIAEVGSNGLPDIYERHRNQIDMSAATSLNGHIKLKFAAEDILNHQYRFEQGGFVTRAYTPGRSFKFGLSYNL